MEEVKKAKAEVIKKFASDNTNEYNEQGTTIIFREGDAPPVLAPIKPNKVRLKGVIGAPAEFYRKRKELHDPNKCHVIFDRNAGTIKLIVDEQFENDNYVVEGSITLAPELTQFKINTKHMYGIKELMELLKFNRVYFKDREANAKIVASLQGFRAKVEKVITEVSDNRGHDERARLTKLEHELEENFILVVPVYKGEAPVEFRVDLCVEATSGGSENLVGIQRVERTSANIVG